MYGMVNRKPAHFGKVILLDFIGSIDSEYNPDMLLRVWKYSANF